MMMIFAAGYSGAARAPAVLVPGAISPIDLADLRKTKEDRRTAMGFAGSIREAECHVRGLGRGGTVCAHPLTTADLGEIGLLACDVIPASYDRKGHQPPVFS
jgi:hypothetical protein